jgi:hypothetical protein
MSVLRQTDGSHRFSLANHKPVVVALTVLGTMGLITVATEASPRVSAGPRVLQETSNASSHERTEATNLIQVGSQESGGYSFRQIEMTEPRDGVVLISFIPEWAGSEFPGKKACAWTLTDAQGSPVGSVSMDLTTMASDYQDPISVDAHEVRAGASSATVVCDAQRLDDPTGRFLISDVRPQQSSRLGSYVDVVFDYAWAGTADPTPQMCDISVIGPDGRVLASRSGGFSGGGNGHGTFAVDLPPESMDKQLTATVTCTSI